MTMYIFVCNKFMVSCGCPLIPCQNWNSCGRTVSYYVKIW